MCASEERDSDRGLCTEGFVLGTPLLSVRVSAQCCESLRLGVCTVIGTLIAWNRLRVCEGGMVTITAVSSI